MNQLNHWEVCLEADPRLYIPFRGEAPGTVRGQHRYLLGTEGGVEYAIEQALNIFPQAKVTAVWAIDVCAERIKQIR